MCPVAPGTVWYGTSNGDLFRMDDADTDTPVQVDLTWDEFPGGAYVSCIAVNPYNADKIVVSFANYGVQSIFKTLDGGITWEHISGNLEENEDGTGSGPAVFWMEYYPNGTLFAGTSTGLYSTIGTDGASTIWELEAGIGNVVINHMDYRTFDGKMVVGTHGGGVYSTDLPAAYTGELEVEKNPSKLFPTVSNTSIYLESENRNLAHIYDLSGKLIQSIQVNSQLTTIDVSAYQNGTYLLVQEGEKGKKFIVQ
jgi:hypothetical protein